MVRVAASDLVKITHKPIREIIVTEYALYAEPEKLAAAVALSLASGQPAALSWVEGVLIAGGPYNPDTDSLAQEFLQGRVYWPLIAFAPMPKYQSSIKATGPELPIIDMSRSATMVEIARWLKQFLPQKAESNT